MRAGMRGALEAIGRIYGGSGLEGRDDFDLLGRFAAGGDERAFRTLVERHGKMVMAVCRQITRNAHDAEDAFQATFLVLARKGPGLWHRGTLAGWLHRVARRVAVEAARKRDLARKIDEAGAVADRARPDRDDLDWLPALHEEIDRLPEKYRSVVVLCDLEELTRDEAARRLGWPPGTVAGRLSRARAQLRARLERRGLVPGGAMLPAAAAVPEALVEAAVSAVVHPGSAAVAATLLAEGALMAMRFSLVRAAAVASVSCAALVAGGLAVAGGGGSPPQEPPAAPPAPAAAVVPESSARPVVGVSQAERPSLAVAPAAERMQFDVLVVDKETRRPVPGATVRAYLDPGKRWFKAGPDGMVRGLRPESVGYEVTVDAWDETHQPTRRSWSNLRGSRYGPLEPMVTIEVEGGKQTVGGRVEDEEGRPIPGVTVELSGIREGEAALAFFELPTVTDGDGRWSCRAIPGGLGSLWANYYHPDYLSPANVMGSGERRRLEQMQGGTHKVILKRGRRLAGRVVDARGVPVAGAILKRPDERGSSAQPEAMSGPDGRFVFPAAPDPFWPRPLMTFAPDLAPDLRWLSDEDRAGPMEIRLGPGREIRGKVADASGRPIRDAWVITRQWRDRGFQEVVALTDADGRFTWAGGPDDAVEIEADSRGFQGHVILCGPGEEAHTWTMESRLVLDLRVADASTGQPIPQFTVAKGRMSEDGGTEWTPESKGASEGRPRNGQAQVSLAESPHGWKLRVEASGYRPLESRLLKVNEGAARLDLRLEPLAFGEGGGPSGVVVDEEGEPVPGAEVVMATPRVPARLRGGAWEADLGGFTPMGVGLVRSDAQGRFTFSAVEGPYTLAAVSPGGYGQADFDEFEETRRVVSRPWGRVKGRVLVGAAWPDGSDVTVGGARTVGEQGGAVDVFVMPDPDRDGRFVIDRLPAGSYRMDISRKGKNISARGEFHVAPGEAVSVTLGGSGRPIAGRVERADGGDARTVVVQIRSDRPWIPFPEEISAESRWGWVRDWEASPEGRSYRRGYIWREAQVNEGGTFRVEDVPEGDYVATFRAGPRSAAEELRFRIEPVPGGRTAEPLDVGTTRLTFGENPRPIEVGVAAPDIELGDLDGKAIKLSDFKEKYVIVVFWETGLASTTVDWSALKSAVQGRDGSLVVLAMSLDDQASRVRSFLAARDDLPPGAIHGLIGPWADNKIRLAYGVNSLPSTFLIGPDGKVLESGVRGEDLLETVRKHLPAR